MTFYSLALMFFAISSVLLGTFVFLKRTDEVGKLFLAFSLACAGWGIGNWWIYTNDTEYAVTLWGTRSAHFCAILIPPFWLHFTCNYLNRESQYRSLIHFFYGCSIILLFFAFTPLFIPHVKSIVGFKFYTHPGPVYHFFTVEFFAAVIITFIILFRGLSTAVGERKDEIRIVFVATLIAFTSGSLTFLPNYDIPFPQYNLFFMPIYPFMMAYAMTKHGFLSAEEIVAVHREKLMLMGLMTSAINHEIRNPLFLIRELANKICANHNLKKEPEILKQAESIQNNVNRIANLVNRLSDFARPTQTKGASDLVNIKQVIGDAIFFTEQELKYQNVDIQMNLPENLPKVKGDKGQLEEIFLNLFMNALHAMPKGGVLRIEARFQAKRTVPSVEIIIADTGHGMFKDELKHVFKPFYTKKGEKGTGLGLYIVKTLVEQNKGLIKVGSELNKGTQFSIFLPLVRE